MTEAKDLKKPGVDQQSGLRSRTTRRKRPVRARTIPIKKITKEQLRIGRLLYSHVDLDRPTMRAQCESAERPCPYVSCKYHLYLDVNPETGSIKLNFPDIEIWEMTETCALDIAERGGVTLEEVGEIMNLTRERIRQLEMSGLTKLMQSDELPGNGLVEFAEAAV
ncbi:MAG: sigma factor-like helix-turn-helix DNA-binding protein [Myxococcota bacterium]|nr:sigma factor-like helix-turn-helix DNA-binding protein [Myxococcota bacterium]